jgi:hypothetical protein
MPRLPRKALAAAVAVVLACALPACGGGDDEPIVRDEELFAPDSAWNRPLPAGAELHPRSDQLVAELQHQLGRADPWINSHEYSAPLYRVPADQRRVRVKLDTDYDRLERDFASVPVPPDAEPAQGSDRHLVVWQPATDTMWEFWKMERRPDGWHARWGGKLAHVSESRGAFAAPLGSTATGIPVAAGLIEAEELRRGRIDHALAFALPEARAGAFSPPATRTDGQTPGEQAIPLGTRFRLDPELDLDRLDLPRPTRTLAEAAQRHGMIARDKAGAVTFYAEAPRPGHPVDLRELLGGRYPSEVLERFPWDELEAVDAPLVRAGEAQ